MGFVIYFLETTGGQMRIYLRGTEATVAKQFLDAAQIGATVEHVRGERVPERVRTDRGVQVGLSEVFVQFSSDAACAEALAGLVDEEGFLVAGFAGFGLSALGQILLYGIHGLLSYRGEALPAALASNVQNGFVKIHISDVQADQLADPYAGRIHYLEHGPIP